MTARTAADLAGINKTTAAYLFHRLREIIAWQLDEASPLDVNVEAFESYFGGKREGKRGRGDGMQLFSPAIRAGQFGWTRPWTRHKAVA